MEITYLSQERHDELIQELQGLKTKGRKEIAERLKFAKELGDLSENSEYHEAREGQSVLERRINELEELLRSASIIKKPTGAATVRIGSHVRLKKNGTVVAYTIVGSSEAKPLEGFISNESPIGSSILGKKVGDVIEVDAPVGKVQYKIFCI